LFDFFEQKRENHDKTEQFNRSVSVNLKESQETETYQTHMKTIIIYTTSGNCTVKAVNELSKKLSGEIVKVDLKKEFFPNMIEFDRVIIGGSVLAGQIDKRIKDFCNLHLDELRNKEIGLFICCTDELEVARHEISLAFPEELHQLAKTEAIFKSSYKLENMSFIGKMLVKRIPKVRENAMNPDENSIDSFATRMEKTYSPFMFLV
jgi:menaquinone-dependent protoporphyrinogen oxidase